MTQPTNERVMYVGTVEYLTGGVSADLTITDSDTVTVSLDHGVTWLAAEWVGPEGVNRQWRILLGDQVPLPTSARTPVYVRITDNPEIPVVPAGTLVLESL